MNAEKVAIISRQVPPVFTGSGTRAIRHAHRLSEMGISVKVYNACGVRCRSQSITVDGPRLPDCYSNIGSLEVMFCPWLVGYFYAEFTSSNIDVVHCIGPNSWFSLSSLVASHICSIASLVEPTMLDGDDLISVYRTKLGLAKEKILKASDATANISPAIQERSLEAGFRKSECFLVPNGVDTEAFNPPEEREKLLLRRKLNISKFSKVLLSVGSVRERKRTKDIIDVFSSLSPDYPETALVLVGPHPERSYLNHIKGLIRKQNLEEKVIFTGRSDHVSDWMKACDIFIFASDQEGLPNVLLEAMSTGMPVVSRSIKGITDFIIEDGRNGILANNNEKMVQEISHILGDGKMRNNMSKMARQRIVNDFSVDKVVGNYLEVFNFISKSKIR